MRRFLAPALLCVWFTGGVAQPAPSAMRRLTHSQYNHTVRDLLGDPSRPADQFPKEDFVHGFTNQSAGQSLSPLLAEAYNRAAEKLARNAFRGGDGRGLVGCRPAGPADAACRERFIRTFGRRAFRRPLTQEEASRYSRIHREESLRAGDFLRGSQLVVEVMLQSPHFLFHLEEGSAPESYRIASRLSYFLWDSMPDEELFADADAGRLAAPGGIRATAERLLASERARLAMDEFLAQWIRFDRLRNAIRDRRLYPEFTAELVEAMFEETRRLFRSLAWEDRNFTEFFTADYAFLSSSLASLYRLPAPAEEFDRVPLPADSGRAGILGQATFLTLTSKPVDTSPTERGLFIREHFLCQIVPPPPPGIDTTLAALTDEKPMTTRQRLAVHLTNPACAGCHQLVDPIGFGFEAFDAIGRGRQKEVVTIYPTQDELVRRVKTKPAEHRLSIDSSGRVEGWPEPAFSSPRELGAKLAANPACQRCVVRQLFRWAAGRRETAADQEAIAAAFERFRASQFRFRELIIAIVTSPRFHGG